MPTDWARAIRIARAAAGLRTFELAARVGLLSPNLAHIEGGRRQPNEAQLEAIAKACGLTVNMLRLLGDKRLRDVLEDR